jgi:hypothetical protein
MAGEGVRGKPCSIFFPVISPDLKRVFFKIAAGNGGDDFMAKNASHRQGLVCYDFEKGACIWQHGKWGHPGWTPDSQHIFEMGNVNFDIHTGKYTKLKDVPNLRGSHPSVSPDGKLMVTDGLTEPVGGKPNEWGILVADMNGGKWVVLHSFEQNRGARSWRRNDPHPVFSADGKRIYYNTSDGQFTRLMVAERPGGLPAVADHWRAFFAAEPEADVEVTHDASEVVVAVRTCPAIRYLREHGREIVPCFCQHCHFVSAAMGAGAGIDVRISGGNGTCTQRFAKAGCFPEPQRLEDIATAS